MLFMFSVSNTSSQTSFQNTVESLNYELIGNKGVLITEFTVLSTNLTAKTRLKLIISCTKNYRYKKLIDLVFVFLYFSLTSVLMIYLIMLVVIGFYSFVSRSSISIIY